MDAQAWLLEAKRLLEQGEFEAAITSYDQALKLKPNMHTAWSNRGVALLKLGQFEAAIVSFDRAIKLKPDVYETWSNQGIALGKLGQFDVAIASHDRAIQLKPNAPDAWYNRANALLNSGQYGAAITSYKRAIELKPDDHNAWLNRGVALGNLGQFEAAVESYNKVLKLKPNNQEAWAYRGLVLSKLGQHEAAIESFEQALELKPDDEGTLFNRGIALGELGQYEAAIASYDKALKLKPNFHEAWFNRGNALHKLGQCEAAITSYDQALQINPDHSNALYNRGMTLHDLGQYEAAIASYDGTLRLMPDDHDVWLKRGVDLHNLGQDEAAVESYDKALTLKPDFHEAWSNRGVALDDLGQHEAAITSYDRALKLKPDYWYAWLNQGVSLEKLGQDEAAILSFDEALKLKPDLYEAWSNRGAALENLRRYEAAITSFDEALKLKSDDHNTLHSRAILLGKLGRYEESIASFDEALNLKPDDHNAWFYRGIALGRLGRYEESITSFDEALNLKPSSDDVWFNRGVTLGKLEQYEAGIASYDQALKFKADHLKAWVNRGLALGILGQFEESIISFDEALNLKPDSDDVWVNRGAAAYNSNRVGYQTSALTLLPALYNPALDQRGYPGRLASLQEGFKYIHRNTHQEGWGRLHCSLGDAHYFHSKYQENPRPYWRDALRSYQTALQTLTIEAFPEPHLEVLQGLIRTHIALGSSPAARLYQQQGSHLFEQLRAAKPDHLKPAFESKFASFSQLEIDLLIGENNPTAALEQAEFYKNRCLTWILDDWQKQPASADYTQAQTLLNPQTAILYWHLSPDALTTFILTTDRDRPFVLDADRRQQAQQFERWMQAWDRQYRDYASQKKEVSDRARHPWRETLKPQLEKLRDILHINALCEQLPSTVDTLILLPHRDLHRFPLQSLFPDRFTAAYLPSLQIGLNLRDRAQDDRHSPLLNVGDPETEQTAMPFAQLESAIVRQLVQPSTHISPTDASLDTVVQALQTSYKTFHFTGHGAYNVRRPEDSAIALTDGLLTAKQIRQLDLSRYNLVCLAACETALTGKDGISTEYVGLASAFLKAGAANVLSTLWQVDEISSTWLMIQFYQRLLAGDTPALALKHAQHWLRSQTNQDLLHWIARLVTLNGLSYRWRKELAVQAESLRNDRGTMEPTDRPYAHPFHWAAFTLTGGVQV